MRIQYASDLHLEFRENSSFLKHNPLAVAGEVLVLAGDIGYIGDENYSRHPFWDWASGNYSRVIVVLFEGTPSQVTAEWDDGMLPVFNAWYCTACGVSVSSSSPL